MNTATIYINSDLSNGPLHEVQVIDGRNYEGMTRSDLKAHYRAYLMELRTRRLLPTTVKGLTWHNARRKLWVIRWQLLNDRFDK